MDYKKAYEALLTGEITNLRERVAFEAMRCGMFSRATEIFDWISNRPAQKQSRRGRPPVKRRGRPPKIETVTLAKTKRRYTKRSAHWKK